MRVCIDCPLIFISAAAFGQDTHFATGPQYSDHHRFADVGASDFSADLIVRWPTAGSWRRQCDRSAHLASGAGEVDEAMLDVGANQLDAQLISDVEALSALRQ
jgi:hypothetical protein